MKVSNGAPVDIYFKLFDTLYKELKLKEDILYAFVTSLKNEAIFQPKLKALLPFDNLSPNEI